MHSAAGLTTCKTVEETTGYDSNNVNTIDSMG